MDVGGRSSKMATSALDDGGAVRQMISPRSRRRAGKVDRYSYIHDIWRENGYVPPRTAPEAGKRRLVGGPPKYQHRDVPVKSVKDAAQVTDPARIRGQSETAGKPGKVRPVSAVQLDAGVSEAYQKAAKCSTDSKLSDSHRAPSARLAVPVDPAPPADKMSARSRHRVAKEATNTRFSYIQEIWEKNGYVPPTTPPPEGWTRLVSGPPLYQHRTVRIKAKGEAAAQARKVPHAAGKINGALGDGVKKTKTDVKLPKMNEKRMGGDPESRALAAVKKTFTKAMALLMA